MRKKEKILCGFLGLMILLVSCGKSVSTVDGYETWKNSSENGVYGLGEAYYKNGFLYYTAYDDIYEYDLLTQKALKLTDESILFVQGLSAEDDGVIYQSSWSPVLEKLLFDTKKQEDFFSLNAQRLVDVYREEDTLYGLKDYREGQFFKVDIPTNEIEVIADNVMIYCVDGESIYYITMEEPEKTLLHVKNESGEKIVELNITPIAVSAEEDRVVLANWGEWELYEYSVSTGELKKLDFEKAQSASYQLCGNVLFYTFLETGEDESEVVTSIRRYDFETGEDVMLLEKQTNANLIVFNENTVFVKNLDGEPLLVQWDEKTKKAIVSKLPTF